MDEFASIKPFLLGLVGDDTSEEEELQPEEVTATMVAVTVGCCYWDLVLVFFVRLFFFGPGETLLRRGNYHVL